MTSANPVPRDESSLGSFYEQAKEIQNSGKDLANYDLIKHENAYVLREVSWGSRVWRWLAGHDATRQVGLINEIIHTIINDKNKKTETIAIPVLQIVTTLLKGTEGQKVNKYTQEKAKELLYQVPQAIQKSGNIANEIILRYEALTEIDLKHPLFFEKLNTVLEIERHYPDAGKLNTSTPYNNARKNLRQHLRKSYQLLQERLTNEYTKINNIKPVSVEKLISLNHFINDVLSLTDKQIKQTISSHISYTAARQTFFEKIETTAKTLMESAQTVFSEKKLQEGLHFVNQISDLVGCLTANEQELLFADEAFKRSRNDLEKQFVKSFSSQNWTIPVQIHKAALTAKVQQKQDTYDSIPDDTAKKKYIPLIQKWEKIIPNFEAATTSYSRDSVSAISINGTPLNPASDNEYNKIAQEHLKTRFGIKATVAFIAEQLESYIKEMNKNLSPKLEDKQIQKIVSDLLLANTADLNPTSDLSSLAKLATLHGPDDPSPTLTSRHKGAQETTRKNFSFENTNRKLQCKVESVFKYLLLPEGNSSAENEKRRVTSQGQSYDLDNWTPVIGRDILTTSSFSYKPDETLIGSLTISNLSQTNPDHVENRKKQIISNLQTATQKLASNPQTLFIVVKDDIKKIKIQIEDLFKLSESDFNLLKIDKDFIAKRDALTKALEKAINGCNDQEIQISLQAESLVTPPFEFNTETIKKDAKGQKGVDLIKQWSPFIKNPRAAEGLFRYATDPETVFESINLPQPDKDALKKELEKYTFADPYYQKQIALAVFCEYLTREMQENPDDTTRQTVGLLISSLGVEHDPTGLLINIEEFNGLTHDFSQGFDYLRFTQTTQPPKTYSFSVTPSEVSVNFTRNVTDTKRGDYKLKEKLTSKKGANEKISGTLKIHYVPEFSTRTKNLADSLLKTHKDKLKTHIKDLYKNREKAQDPIDTEELLLEFDKRLIAAQEKLSQFESQPDTPQVQPNTPIKTSNKQDMITFYKDFIEKIKFIQKELSSP